MSSLRDVTEAEIIGKPISTPDWSCSHGSVDLPGSDALKGILQFALAVLTQVKESGQHGS